MGSQPSINNFGQVAFVGDTSAGESLWTNGTITPININPGFANAGTLFFGQAAQINDANQVAAEDRVTTSTPASTAVRIWNARSLDSFTYVARGGPGRAFDAVFGFPSIDLAGDVAFAALSGTQKYLGSLPAGTSTPILVPITAGAPQPMMDDNGDILLAQTVSGQTAIWLYPNDLSSHVVIADSTMFSALDNDPGISNNGRVVAFMGTLSAAGATALGIPAGPGIFISADEGGGQRKIVRVTGLQVEDLTFPSGNHNGICDPGEVCKPAAELGYDIFNNPISFISYASTSRIGVIDVDFGAAGIDDDSIVISFVAIPSAASKPNTVVSFPMMFSAQQGVWTIRVDVTHQLTGAMSRVYLPYTAIPVAQVGDKIAGRTITGLGVGFSLGLAAKDESGTFRTMRRGDHRVAFWASTSGGQMIVRGNHLDSDQDGLLDHWETTGIDMDQDGVPDLTPGAMGADPMQRDLFVQLDFLSDGGNFTFELNPGVTHPLPGQTISPFESMYRAAPALQGNQYGVRYDGQAPADIPPGIVPHVDAGIGLDMTAAPFSLNIPTQFLTGGNKIPAQNSNQFPEVIYFGVPGSQTLPGVVTRSFQEMKDTFFSLSDKRAREFVFHYGILGMTRGFFTQNNGTPFLAQVASATATSTTTSFVLPKNSMLNQGGDFVKITTGTGAGQYSELAPGQFTNTSNTLKVTIPFTTVPDSTSAFTLIHADSGEGELQEAPPPDSNSLPGNDFMLTFRTFGINSNGRLGTTCEQWRTLAHELGHNLGLRHGGTDDMAFKGNSYLSLMSYSHQTQCVPPDTVQSYSTVGDPTFDDFANLKMNFSDVEFHMGNSLLKGLGGIDEADGPDREETRVEYELLNGPSDLIAPTVTITAPLANGPVTIGPPLTVTFTAVDNVAVSSVYVAFDVNGNGVIDPGETVPAMPVGPNQYMATFGSIGGSAGPRIIRAYAIDPSTNLGMGTISVLVGATVSASADLAIGLAAMGSTVVGQNLTYQVTVTNSGPSTATAVMLTDTLPAGVTFVSSTPSQGSCSGTATVTCSLGNIANAGTATVAIVITPTGAGMITDSASVTSSTTDPNTANNIASLPTNITAAPASADLSVAIVPMGSTVVGQNLTYQVTVTNAGPSTATAAMLTDTLPAGVTFVSSTPSQGSCSGTVTVTCSLGDIPNAGTATIAIVITPTAAGMITDTASVTSSTTDPNTGNNSASLPTNITAAPTSADLSIAIVPMGSTVVGQNLTYQVTVTNSGPSTATAVMLTDTLPAGVTFISSTPSQGSCSGTATVICNLGNIANAGTASVAIVITPTASGMITDVASVTSSTTDPNTGNNSASLPTNITAAPTSADLSVAIVPMGSTLVGQNLTYQVTVTNSGPSTATAVMLTDTLPAGVAFVSSTPSQGSCSGTATVTCSLGSITNAGTATVAIVITTTATGMITDNASVMSSTTDPNTANNMASLPTIITAPAASADLSVALATMGSTVVGQNLTYQVTVTNAGPSTATAVMLTDTLPAGVTFVSTTPSQGSCSGTATVTCSLGDIASAGTATVAIVITTTATGMITDNASVTSSISDPNTANNTASLPTNISPAAASADLSVALTSMGSTVLGQNLTYQVTVTNAGPSTATGVMLTDTLPAGVTLVSSTPSQGSCLGTATVTCNLGSIANAGTATVAIVITTTVTGMITDGATVTSATSDPNTANNTASLPVNITGPPATADLSVTLSVMGSTFVGQSLTYLVTVSNGGPSAATGVMLTDTLPAGITFGMTTPSQGSCSGMGPVACSLGTIASGGSATVMIAITPLSAGLLTDSATVSGSPSDPNTANNTASLQTNVTGLPGDVNGDGQTDCVDISIVKASFGKRAGQTGFDPRADVNNDGVVDIRDLAFVSRQLPAGTHCP